MPVSAPCRVLRGSAPLWPFPHGSMGLASKSAVWMLFVKPLLRRLQDRFPSSVSATKVTARLQSGPDAPGGLLQSGGLLLSFSSSCTCGSEEARLLPERALGVHQVRLPGRQLDLLAGSVAGSLSFIANVICAHESTSMSLSVHDPHRPTSCF